MGTAFLRHVERCKVVLHVVDGGAEDAIERYHSIRKEMELFDARLARKKEVVLVNKADLPGVRERWERELKTRFVEAVDGHRRIRLVSAKARSGLEDVMKRLRALVDSVLDEGDVVLLGDEDAPGDEVLVDKIGHGRYSIGGWKIERVYKMTNWDYVEGVDRFQRVLSALGVNRQLAECGAVDGDVVKCFDREFEYFAEENVYSAAAVLDGYTD